MTTDTPTAIDMAALAEKYAAWEAAAAALVPENKARLFAFLDSARITRVIVLFDGEGDSGQIEDVQPYSDAESVPLRKHHLLRALDELRGRGLTGAVRARRASAKSESEAGTR